jgi:lysophospholipase L1-like esterase
MWHDDVVGREATTAGENLLEQRARGSNMDPVYADMHAVVPSSPQEGTGMSGAAHVLSWAPRVPLTPCAGQTATAVLERMVTAALGHRGRTMLIGLLTILAFTAGASARRVHPVMHRQTLRRQILAAQRVMPQPVERMVAVGDSITKGDWDVDELGGWVTRLGTKLHAAYSQATFRLSNAGVDGDTTAGVLARLARDVLAPHPQLVIVSIGTNDFDDGVPRTQFAEQLQTLVRRLQAAPHAPIVILASMLPIAGQTPGQLVMERTYNDVIRRVAAAVRVGYLDLFDAWLGLGPSYLHALRHDAEHPNPIGYEWIASTTAAFLEAGYLDAQGRVMTPRIIPTCSPVLCGSSEESVRRNGTAITADGASQASRSPVLCSKRTTHLRTSRIKQLSL